MLFLVKLPSSSSPSGPSIPGDSSSSFSGSSSFLPCELEELPPGPGLPPFGPDGDPEPPAEPGAERPIALAINVVAAIT